MSEGYEYIYTCEYGIVTMYHISRYNSTLRQINWLNKFKKIGKRKYINEHDSIIFPDVVFDINLVEKVLFTYKDKVIDV